MNAAALGACHSISDLRSRAERGLPCAVFDFLDGGAESELTARRNIAAFDDISIVPRCLVDVSSLNLATRILGQTVSWPVLCGPTGASRLFHRDGEMAVARAADSTGTLYCLSTGSTCSLEEVAAASIGPKAFQLYIYRDREITWELIERCKRAGYPALCVTVDLPAVGKRERDLRSGFGMTPRWSARSLSSFLQHPRWVVDRLGKGAIVLANFANRTDGKVISSRAQLDSSITWKDVRTIAELWRGPLAIKGIMSADDARRASEAGATAVIVSNHGGRQLDGAAATVEVLPEIAKAVGSTVEIILDGGIRRGVHVLKALALGAHACSVGRPYLYGLAAGGEAGVKRALELLQAEFALAMKLTGCPDLASIGDILTRTLRVQDVARGVRKQLHERTG